MKKIYLFDQILDPLDGIRDLIGYWVLNIVNNIDISIIVSLGCLFFRFVINLITEQRNKKIYLKDFNYLYNFAYRCSIILYRIYILILAFPSLCQWRNQLVQGKPYQCFVNHYDLSEELLFSFFTFFIYEQSILVSLWLNRRKITTRRIFYMVCHMLLVLHTAFENTLALNLLITNHIIDLAKDFLHLTIRDKELTSFIYNLKPIILMVPFMGYLINNYIQSNQLLVPLSIILLSLCDSISRIIN